MPPHEKIHRGRGRDVEWSLRESAVQNCGSLGLSSGESELAAGVHVAIKSDATAAIGMVHRLGLGKVRHLVVGDLWEQHHVRSGKIRVSEMSGLVNSI